MVLSIKKRSPEEAAATWHVTLFGHLLSLFTFHIGNAKARIFLSTSRNRKPDEFNEKNN
jgi:hypothetical protein